MEDDSIHLTKSEDSYLASTHENRKNDKSEEDEEEDDSPRKLKSLNRNNAPKLPNRSENTHEDSSSAKPKLRSFTSGNIDEDDYDEDEDEVEFYYEEEEEGSENSIEMYNEEEELHTTRSHTNQPTSQMLKLNLKKQPSHTEIKRDYEGGREGGRDINDDERPPIIEERRDDSTPSKYQPGDKTARNRHSDFLELSEHIAHPKTLTAFASVVPATVFQKLSKILHSICDPLGFSPRLSISSLLNEFESFEGKNHKNLFRGNSLNNKILEEFFSKQIFFFFFFILASKKKIHSPFFHSNKKNESKKLLNQIKSFFGIKSNH